MTRFQLRVLERLLSVATVVLTDVGLDLLLSS